MSELLIKPGATIGIMGGGQLGRMLAHAASALGYRTHVFTPEENSPASECATRTTVGEYSDQEAIAGFARNVDVVTFEFENVPAASLEVLEHGVYVAPSLKLLSISQNRIREKDFLRSIQVATTDYAAIRDLEALRTAAATVGLPAVLKTTELGYDGKGQVKLYADTDLSGAWLSLDTREAILERFVDYELEISVIVARSARGEVVAYEPAHNQHTNHILDTTALPAPISATKAAEAQEIAIRIATHIGLVGLLAVEMFLTTDGALLVNELAPRPHNSGHWTMDACATSQFEQHIRAICNWPLGSVERHRTVTMKNLIGGDIERWRDYADDPRAKIHLYGKKHARPGRKMGHVNILGDQK